MEDNSRIDKLKKPKRWRDERRRANRVEISESREVFKEPLRTSYNNDLYERNTINTPINASTKHVFLYTLSHAIHLRLLYFNITLAYK